MLTPLVLLLRPPTSHPATSLQVEVASKYSTVDTLRQQYLFVPAKHKDCYLTYVLTGGCAWLGLVGEGY